MISLRIVSLKEKKENENSKSESFFDLDDVVQKVLLFVVCSRLLFAARRNITFDREHSLRMPWIEVRVSRIFTGNQDSPKPGFLPTPCLHLIVAISRYPWLTRVLVYSTNRGVDHISAFH